MPWVGQPLERLEDEALLRGEGWFMDDLSPFPHAAEAAVVRSTMAHARITGLDVSAALECEGVVGVLTGDDVAALSSPFPSALGVHLEYYAAAVGVTRYVGEPIAVVVARDRYLAEDAAEQVMVDYEPLPVVADPVAAMDPGAPALHAAAGSNVVSDRHFTYGDPHAALTGADLVVRHRFRHPRSSCTPVEGYGVACHWDAATGSVTAWSNFQGPFTLHGVAAAALGIHPGRLHLVSPPDSGGSFGIKSAVFHYVVLMALASRRLGVPVRWTEDRVEHLLASSMATERLTEVEAGFSSDGELVGLRLDLVDDVGAYVRAPEPATLYRMHSCITGPYRVRHVGVRSRVVLTNRCPSGLNRGFGGPQLYLALERTMAIAAGMLGVAAEEVELAEGLARVAGEPGRSVPLRRVAGTAHWDPTGLPKDVEPGLALTLTYSVPGLGPPDEDDRVNGSGAYGFLVDVAAVEVDRETGEVAVRSYVSVHDAGRVLNPALAHGQVLGGLAHGIGAALFERHVYDAEGNLLTSTFLDYCCPTATELPSPVTAMAGSPSPVTPLGAKGMGEGNTMSAPAALANAVADALGVEDVEIPLTPARVWALSREVGS